MPALPLADYFSAYEGAVSLMAAITAVSRGSQGTRVVVSMSETLKEIQSGLVKEYQLSAITPKPGETLFSGKYPCYRLYKAQDGRNIAVGAIEFKFWKKVCEILSLPHLIPQGYSTGELGENTIREVEGRFASKPWQEWEKAFEPADCCVEAVKDYSEVFGRGI